MKINNLDENNYIEKLYEINHGENKETILVTGSHLIYDPILQKFVHIKDYKSDKYKISLSDKNTEVLTCLITSDHIIPIGQHIFHDWEDNQN